MRLALFGTGLIFCTAFTAAGQQSAPVAVPNYAVAPPGSQVDSVASDISRISQSVDALNKNLAKFFNNFSSNQGLRLTDRQQRLLFALEVLNRTELGLANAQKQRLEFTERNSRFRLQLAAVNENLLPQSIDRHVSSRGTTNAVELREARRSYLQKEQIELSNAVVQIQGELDRLNEEIRKSEFQVASIRARLFGQVEKELADL